MAALAFTVAWSRRNVAHSFSGWPSPSRAVVPTRSSAQFKRIIGYFGASVGAADALAGVLRGILPPAYPWPYAHSPGGG